MTLEETRFDQCCQRRTCRWTIQPDTAFSIFLIDKTACIAFSGCEQESLFIYYSEIRNSIETEASLKII
jgi:hypothetical protein